MITSEFRKKMASSWFSYLQSQICKEFEAIENNKIKFIKREWKKNNRSEGGGTSFLLSRGKVFDKVGVNRSTVSGTFPKKFRSNIFLGRKIYWSEKFFESKTFFGSKNYLGRENFLGRKIFRVENIFRSKILFGSNFFLGRTIFLG